MPKKELQDMVDALESAIRSGSELVIGLTVGQILESLKNHVEKIDD